MLDKLNGPNIITKALNVKQGGRKSQERKRRSLKMLCCVLWGRGKSHDTGNASGLKNLEKSRK